MPLRDRRAEEWMPTSFNIPSTVITGAGASLELGALVKRLVLPLPVVDNAAVIASTIASHH